jgi:transcriptional regulator
VKGFEAHGALLALFIAIVAGTRANPGSYTIARYVAVKHMNELDDREWKKGSAGLLIFALLEDGPCHGYEIAKLIDSRSQGALHFRVTSLYPLLYRLEERRLIEGRWVEKAGQRRRRYYRLTTEGRALLERQRRSWKTFVEAVGRVTGIDYA